MACVGKTPCKKSDHEFTVVNFGSNFELHISSTVFVFEHYATNDNIALQGVGLGEDGQGMRAITIFKDLDFVFSSHVLIDFTETDPKIAANVSLIGSCIRLLS
ncbi:hypothetical protein ACMU_07825 [Actibacterium mucosum KCTC 23349]|uniref:Uncharacterized protein n=2 Tax=Actibacterium TaxID=1433986 RepID=A0A037ZMQ5_9RHOB|nr:hypothetical protein ACMU_07825 [Actibacterium mucosum KCTC 23349]